MADSDLDLFQATLASIGDAVIATDRQCRVLLINAAAQDLTGCSGDQAKGQPVAEVMRLSDRLGGGRIANPADQVLRSGQIAQLPSPTVLLAAGDREIFIDGTAAPIRDDAGNLRGVVLTFRDDSQNRRAEDRLSNSELRYRLIGQAANDAIWDWDLVINRVVWNEGLQSKFGYPPNDVGEDASWWVRQQAERRLRYQHDLTRAITDNATTAIFMMDDASRCTFMNPAAEAMTGFAFAEVDGEILHDLIHHTRPDGSPYPMPQCPLDRALPEHLEVRNHEDLFFRKNGESFPVICNARVIHENQVPVGTVIEVRDVTEERAVAETIRQSEANFRQLAEAMPQMVWIARADGHVEYFNDRWYDHFGTSPDQSLGDGWITVLHPDDRASTLQRWTTALAGGQSYQTEYRLRGRDGQYRWFLGRGVPVCDDTGGVQRWFGTCTDIDEAKRLQEELRAVAARLSEADRRKDEFLATLAHELRNPLAPIRMGLEVMKLGGQGTAALQEIRETMERQTQQLITLVDDLLDVSRITQGKLRLRRCEVMIAEVVRSAVEASRPWIDEAGHRLNVSVPREPIGLHADPNRLAQVISNLLNNAVKYTPGGGQIELSVRPIAGNVEIVVRDDGIGIPAEMQRRVFEMFAQINGPLEKGYVGLGIGLTLVRSLVEMHGGTIAVHSEGEGRGSEFTVRLPIATPPPPRDDVSRNDDPGPSQAAAQPPRRRVLVVDDNQAAANMLAMVVKMLGNEVRTAGDGQQAIEVAAEYLPEVVLMDIGMPRLNGYEAARHIRQQSWGGAMLLVALTGWGQEEDRQRTRDAGFDHHLVKPADPATLKSLLRQR